MHLESGETPSMVVTSVLGFCTTQARSGGRDGSAFARPIFALPFASKQYFDVGSHVISIARLVRSAFSGLGSRVQTLSPLRSTVVWMLWWNVLPRTTHSFEARTSYDTAAA